MNECCKCKKWMYNKVIEKRYGEGTGVCTADREPKGCNRRGCILFEEIIEEEI